MKRLIPLFLCLTMIVGCESEPKQPTYVVNESSIANISQNSNDYKIIIIEDCEYIYMGNYDSQTITHKGNCNNPIHNK